MRKGNKTLKQKIKFLERWFRIQKDLTKWRVSSHNTFGCDYSLYTNRELHKLYQMCKSSSNKAKRVKDYEGKNRVANRNFIQGGHYEKIPLNKATNPDNPWNWD